MALAKTEKIWMNGRLIPWDQANVHVMSHVVHYGSCIFEGIRCYKTPGGSAVFRLDRHIARMFDGCRIYRICTSATVKQALRSTSIPETLSSIVVAMSYIGEIALSASTKRRSSYTT